MIYNKTDFLYRPDIKEHRQKKYIMPVYIGG